MEIIVFNAGDSFSQELSRFLPSVERGLDVVANDIQSSFLQPTKQWTHKPQFNIIKSEGRREIYTQDERYVWINDGTHRSGEITGKGGKKLWLPNRYIPKTRPNDIFGYGGVREYERGKNVVKGVKKSSIRARKWEDWIYTLYTEYINIEDFLQRQINAT